MVKKHTEPYENNPFFIGLNGLKLFFNNAQSVAIYAIILCVVVFVFNAASNVADLANGRHDLSKSQIERQDRADQRAVDDFFSQDPGRIAVAGVLIASIIFIIVLVLLILNGILEYTGARLALGEKVELAQAFKEVIKDLGGYLWVNVIVIVKIFLWSLLLIVPGIIMSVRYKLAGTVFFAEGKHGNAAVKRSLELTKGAWFTTQAGYGLWNLMTFNQIPQLLTPGSSAVLYRQLRDVTDAGEQKPPAHWLSWLTFFVPIALAVVFLLLLLFLFVALSAYGS
jgi:ABC-type multidrug transport system fused ATPase/permease subunit